MSKPIFGKKIKQENVISLFSAEFAQETLRFSEFDKHYKM